MFRRVVVFAALAVASVSSGQSRGSDISFKEWAVATSGAFPHDPLATADGAIWYTGQRASLLGRIAQAAVWYAT